MLALWLTRRGVPSSSQPKMVEALKTDEAGRGVAITTPGFQPKGTELQHLLDTHVDKGL